MIASTVAVATPLRAGSGLVAMSYDTVAATIKPPSPWRKLLPPFCSVSTQHLTPGAGVPGKTLATGSVPAVCGVVERARPEMAATLSSSSVTSTVAGW